MWVQLKPNTKRKEERKEKKECCGCRIQHFTDAESASSYSITLATS
jgi:hypothetical protein